MGATYAEDNPQPQKTGSPEPTEYPKVETDGTYGEARPESSPHPSSTEYKDRPVDEDDE